jgi:hypothetical protein
MSNRNSHTNSSYDLGIDSSYGAFTSREDVDESFSLGNINTGYQCASCGQPPKYKLIARKPELDTEELNRIGYMCEQCVKNMSPQDYGLRQI